MILLLFYFVFSVGALECRYACNDPVCNLTCIPVCHRPVCEIQCNSGAPQSCSHANPLCAIQCPQDQLWDESCPMCETVCQPLPSVCSTCTVLCEPTNCAWRCAAGHCPEPTCQLQCESPACEAEPVAETPQNSAIRFNGELLFAILAISSLVKVF
jgi:hypothetical protein